MPGEADLPGDTYSSTPDNRPTHYPTVTPLPNFVPTATPNYRIIDTDTYLVSPTLAVQEPTNAANQAGVQPTNIINQPNHLEEGNPFIIGYSVNGLPLEMYRFGSGEQERLIIAGIHGGYEYNTTNLAFELIGYLELHPEVIPENQILYILPTLNPDGLSNSHGYTGRSNANNVDLNRNWDMNWKPTWNPDGCWQYLPITGGIAPFSEPEVTALNDFILQRNLSAVISYHSAALGIFAGGYPDTEISTSLAEFIAEVAPYPYPPIFTGCEFTGQFTDYLASIGIPAVDIELSNHKDSDFDINLRILHQFLTWEP